MRVEQGEAAAKRNLMEANPPGPWKKWGLPSV